MSKGLDWWDGGVIVGGGGGVDARITFGGGVGGRCGWCLWTERGAKGGCAAVECRWSDECATLDGLDDEDKGKDEAEGTSGLLDCCLDLTDDDEGGLLRASWGWLNGWTRASIVKTDTGR
jgi:hypothetical protein